MNIKTYRVIGGVVFVIIIALVAFFLFGKPQQTTEQPTASEITQDSGEDESITGSILSLLRAGRNVECTFSRADDDGTMNGHVYLAGEKMYGEFMTQAGDQSFDTYVIRDGDYTYSWSSQSNQGTKVKIDEAEATASSEERDNAAQNLDEDLDLKCKGWTVDNSKFVPPGNIEFVDFSTQVERVQETDLTQEEVLQAVCDQLTGEAKEQCLQAINQ